MAEDRRGRRFGVVFGQFVGEFIFHAADAGMEVAEHAEQRRGEPDDDDHEPDAAALAGHR